MTRIEIADDLDLEKIRISGQCFRVKKMDDDAYRFITGDDVLYIKELNETAMDPSKRARDPHDPKHEQQSIHSYEISCDKDTWQRVWHPYFDLDRNYANIRKEALNACSPENKAFIENSIDAGYGIRILNQDAWEMLVTFIISQRKNMPAIAKSVEAISNKFGEPITTDRETIYAFPTAEALAQATEDDLRKCSLGYRAPYVLDAARKVTSGDLDLQAISTMQDDELFEKLQMVHGVGKKVANCICLFGYARHALVPVDVWIARAIETECCGVDPFEQFGEYAGIIQQYVFFNMTNPQEKK